MAVKNEFEIWAKLIEVMAIEVTEDNFSTLIEEFSPVIRPEYSNDMATKDNPLGKYLAVFCSDHSTRRVAIGDYILKYPDHPCKLDCINSEYFLSHYSKKTEIICDDKVAKVVLDLRGILPDD